MRLTIFRALRHRNFGLFASGQAFALIGYWMQAIAQSWLLYRLTGSATLLGVLAFASSLPILLLAPLAGLWSDRANLHRTMFTVQVLETVGTVCHTPASVLPSTRTECVPALSPVRLSGVAMGVSAE